MSMNKATHMSIPKAVSNEEDEEPSPVGTPNQRQSPHPVRHQSLRNTNNKLPSFSTAFNARSNNFELYEDASIPSLPEAPSPYSPPPASLLSNSNDNISTTGTGTTEEDPWATRRRHKHNQAPPHPPPLREVRTTSRINTTFDTDDQSLEQHLNRALHQFPPATTATATTSNNKSTAANHTANNAHALALASDRSSLLPAVLNLKKELQESQESLYLLRQENRALVSECERYQSQRAAWKQATEEEHEAWQEQQATARQELEQLRNERKHLEKKKKDLQFQLQSLDSEMTETRKGMEELVQQNRSLQAELESLRQQRQAWDDKDGNVEHLKMELGAAKEREDNLKKERALFKSQVVDLEAQVRELKTKIKEQSVEAAKKMRFIHSERDVAEKTLRKEYASSKLEIDRLKAVIFETKKQKEESEAVQQSWKQQNEASLQEIERLNSLLQTTQERMALEEEEAINTAAKLRNDINELETALEKALCQEIELRTALQEKEALLEAKEEELAATNEAHQSSMDQLEAALSDTKEKFVRTKKDSASQSKELHGIIDELESVATKLQSDNDRLCAENDSLRAGVVTERDFQAIDRDLRAENDTHLREIDRLKEIIADTDHATNGKRKERSPGALELKELIRRLILEKTKLNGVKQSNERLFKLSEMLKQINEIPDALEDMLVEWYEFRKDSGNLDRAPTTEQRILKDAACQTDTVRVEHSPEPRTASPEADVKCLFPNSITERLGRIRDAAERAALVQEYRRELASLTREHEEELARLEQQHEDAIKDATQKAQDDAQLELNQYKKRLETAQQAKITALEKKHEAELKRVRIALSDAFAMHAGFRLISY